MTNPTFITTALDSGPNALEAYNYSIQQNKLNLEFDCYDYGARFSDVNFVQITLAILQIKFTITVALVQVLQVNTISLLQNTCIFTSSLLQNKQK
ncbi:MAG: hypothetical protein J7K39_02010 [Bacteroidales bacterium]|nr:hypothetical protein [Bacteroidales bacterium]